jgi:hypothetical protein
MTTDLDLRVLEHREIQLLNLEHGSTLKNLRYVSKTVNLAHPPRYCWGAAVANSSLKTIYVDGLLRKVRPTLYSFLKEMATHDAGSLMWIDSICLYPDRSRTKCCRNLRSVPQSSEEFNFRIYLDMDWHVAALDDPAM